MDDAAKKLVESIQDRDVNARLRIAALLERVAEQFERELAARQKARTRH